MENMNMLENISCELEGIARQLICLAVSLNARGGGPSEETLDLALNSAASHISRLASVLDTKDAEIQEVKE